MTLQEQKGDIANAIRALITSQKQQPCFLRDILRDYEEVDGKSIDFRKFGYKNIEDFLESTGEFTLSRIGGKTCIILKYSSSKSAHITAMVREQKRSKSKRITPLPSRPPRRSDQSWNKSSFSKSYQKMSPPPSRRSHSSFRFNISSSSRSTTTNNSHNCTNVYNQPQIQKQREWDNNKDLRNLLNAKYSQQSENQQPIVGNANNKNDFDARDRINQRNGNGPRAILGQNNSLAAAAAASASSAAEEEHLKKQEERLQQRQILLQEQQKNNTNFSSPPCQQLPPVPPRPAKSVQNRLKLAVTINNNSNNNNNNNKQANDSPPPSSNNLSMSSATPTPTSADSVEKDSEPVGFVGRTRYFKSHDYQPPNNIAPKVFEFDLINPVVSLENYCVARNFLMPQYSVYRSISNFGKYQCRVTVNGSVYSTYPNEYTTESAAKVASATQAINEISQQEQRRNLPKYNGSDYDLELKIYEELQDHPCGIFSKNLPDWFAKNYNQTLPDHWWTIVQNSKKLDYETNNENIIIFRKEDSLTTDQQLIRRPSLERSTSQDDANIIRPPNIILPWHEKYWNLYITSCESSIAIWGRLFGKDYSDQFENLMNDIDVFMLTDKQSPPPNSIQCKQFYLVCISECWHRVQLLEIDKTNNVALCFFIDFGEEEWLPCSDLYHCDAKFLQLPAQAIAFSLFGLEDFAENPYAKKHLETRLLNKSVVGEILATELTYKKYENDYRYMAKGIQAVLWDTSSSEDINLNPLILNSICDDTKPPELKRGIPTSVTITYVNDNGDVYMQVENPESLYVQKLILQLIESKFKKQQHKVNKTDMTRWNMFLICDDEDICDIPEEPSDEKNRLSCSSSSSSTSTSSSSMTSEICRWYRGTLLANPNAKNDDNYYDIFFIDYGYTKRIHISKIYRLESLSAALSKFPRQAILAKLSQIPSITPEIVGRIRALLPVNLRAWAKMLTSSSSTSIPEIIIYKRVEANGTLCNVNEALKMEYEIQSSFSLLSPEGPKLPLGYPTYDQKNLPIIDSNETTTICVPPQVSTQIKTSPPAIKTRKSVEKLEKIPTFGNIPQIGEYFRVRVVMAANPVNFTVQPYDEYPEMLSMMKELQTHCGNSKEVITFDEVEIGEEYAVKSSDGFYYRATIVNKYGFEMIHVYFCDFGHIEIVSSDKVKHLAAKFRKLPKQALQAKLYGIAAIDDWNFDDCHSFRKLTIGKTFVSVIKGISTDTVSPPDTQILELDLIDVETQVDIYIRQILINEGRAIDISKNSIN